MALNNLDVNNSGKVVRKIKAKRAGQIPLQVQAAASQTANLVEYLDSTGAVLASVGPAGQTQTAAGTIGTTELADAAVTSAKLDEKTVQYAEVAISKAEILTLNTVGKTLVAAPGAGKVIEFISMLLIHDFDTAAYTGGGTINVLHDATVVSNVISTANSFGAGADTMAFCVALDTANGIALAANKALILKCNTGDFTDPGTAAGVGRAKVAYRVHSTGL